MKDEDYEAFDDGERLEGGIRTAVKAWFEHPAAAKAQYGPIASWDTSEITNMSCLFEHMFEWNFNGDLSGWDVSSVTDMHCMFLGATSFNADLSGWDVSSVTDMECMFRGATSFTRQLSGAWSTSTASMTRMFGGNCPGSLSGKTNDINGTPQ